MVQKNICALKLLTQSIHMSPLVCFQNRGGGLDMNVIPAWREQITGRGIVVSILDDGIEKDHPDLKINYVSHFTCFGTLHSVAFERCWGYLVPEVLVSTKGTSLVQIKRLFKLEGVRLITVKKFNGLDVDCCEILN